VRSSGHFYVRGVNSKEAGMTPFKVLLAAVVVSALAASCALASSDSGTSDREITVMTRNLFLGTDLEPIFAAATLPTLASAVGAGWEQVQANDFPARAGALAGEIAANKPDLVGLQEAMLFRTDAPADGPASPAETGAMDFVALLVAALADRGLSYKAVATFEGTDAELPAGWPPPQDVRLTDRVVVLVHSDPQMKVSNARTGAYSAAFSVNTFAGLLRLPRGWASVDVKLRGASFRFVTTHLEAFAAPIRNAQAAELAKGPASTKLPVVLVGDMNSGPGGDGAAYGVLRRAGFVDAWKGGGGLTCCHAVDLHDATPTLTKRVDLVLTKRGFKSPRVAVVGEEPGDRTAGGLWPSDHAGVVATLRPSK
jgi:endonuclease/exonuclease/phosphatase family metal-dependent hydrolase